MDRHPLHYSAAVYRAAFYAYDANGNVTELVDVTGVLKAHYEYNAFGTTTAMTGDWAAANPFRCSTKYFDTETGLYYYGYRFYAPQWGRWLSIDPIGIFGGVGLYQYCMNNPCNRIDKMGLTSEPVLLILHVPIPGRGTTEAYGFTKQLTWTLSIDSIVEKGTSCCKVDITEAKLKILAWSDPTIPGSEAHENEHIRLYKLNFMQSFNEIKALLPTKKLPCDTAEMCAGYLRYKEQWHQLDNSVNNFEYDKRSYGLTVDEATEHAKAIRKREALSSVINSLDNPCKQ